MHSWEYGFGSEETQGLRDVGEFTNGVFSVVCDAGYKAPASPLPQSWLLNPSMLWDPPTPNKVLFGDQARRS